VVPLYSGYIFLRLINCAEAVNTEVLVSE